jgi:hypothetical protein
MPGVIDQLDQSGDFIDRDYYEVTLTGGRRYTFSADANVSTSDTLDQVFIRVRDASGNTLSPDAFAEGAAPSLTFDAPGSGTARYYLAVSGGGSGAWWDKTGSFTARFADTGTAPVVNHKPTAQGHDQTLASGTPIPLSTLFTYGDADGSSDIVRFAVQDRTPGGGYLTFDSTPQAADLKICFRR